MGHRHTPSRAVNTGLTSRRLPARGRSARSLRRAIAAMCEPLESRLLLSTLWVDPVNGNDTWAGTQTQPYRTIGHALDKNNAATKGGDTILLKSGTYREDVSLNSSKSGTSSVPTTIMAASGATPIIDGSDLYTSGWTQVGTSSIYKRTGWTAQTQQVALNGGAVLTQIGSEFDKTTFAGVAADQERVIVGSNSTSSMVAGSFFCDTANDVLYVWLPDGSNPNGQNVNISARDGWIMSGGSYYLISGITFQYNNDVGSLHNASNDTWLGNAITVPSNSTLQNCTIRWADTQAIGLSTGSKVLNNTITYSGSNGIVGGTSNFLVSGNHILYSNYRHFAADWGSGGMKLMPNAWGTVSGNEIAYSNGSGLWSDTNNSGSWMTFSGNYIHDNIPTAADYGPDNTTPAYHIFGEAGIKIEVSSYVRVYNNVVVGNFGNGILVCASNNTLVYNNTVVGNKGYAGIQVGEVPRRTGTTGGVNGVGDDDFLVHNRVYNNIIANNYAMYDLMIQADYYAKASWDPVSYWWAQDNLSDNNLIYRWGGPLQLTTGSPYGKGMTATQTTLASWRTASGADNSGDSGASQDVNSISVDPLFLPATTADDYRLGANSLAINAGANTVAGTNTNPSALFNTDYSTTPTGVAARNGTYDIGAYEYHAGDPVGTAGTVPPPDPTAWVDDALPQGAVPTSDSSPHDNWSWVGTGPTPVSGMVAMESAAYSTSGINSTEFSGATTTMSVKTGDTLYAWVYLDPSDKPSEIMIQWRTGSSWEHRAYWGTNGDNSINYGTNSTNSRRWAGALPTAGGWVKLQIAASLVGLEGVSVNGLSLVQYNGRAAWEDIGAAPAAGVAPAAPSNLAASIPVIGQIRLTWKDNSSTEIGFNIERSTDGSNFSVIGTVGSGAMTYTDTTFDSSSTTLYYRVQAYNANGGSYSSTSSFRIAPDNAFFLNEGSGPTTFNGYGQGNGTLNGTPLPTWIAGKSGEALSFDGVSANGDYVGCGNDSSFDATTGLTLGAWLRPSSTGGWTTSGVDKRNAYRIVSVDVGTVAAPVAATHFQFALYDSTGTFQACLSAQTYSTNTWHYVVGTYDGTTMTLYVDGVVSQTVTQTNGMSTSTYPFEIGRRDGTRYYSGAIDEVRMYKRAISKAEMTAAYNTYEAPTDIGLSNAAVVENQPAGTGVGSLSTSDPDVGDSFTYLLVAGTGSADNASFTISGNQLKTTQSFSFAGRNSYSIRVRTTDASGLFFEKAFVINITPVALTWNGGTGNWTDITKWSPSSNFPNNGNGGCTYDVTVNSGTVTLDQSITIHSLTLGDGATLRIAQTTGAQALLTVNSLTIVGSGKLDLADNAIAVNYSGGVSPIGNVVSWLKSGRNGGTWDGSGINSSTATANSSYGVGVSDDAAGQLVKVMFTLLGDTNLDGKVDVADLGTLLNNYGQAGKIWSDGQFTYNASGAVDVGDLGLLLNNYGQANAALAGLTSGTLSSTPSADTKLQVADTNVVPTALQLAKVQTVATQPTDTSAAPAGIKLRSVQVVVSQPRNLVGELIWIDPESRRKQTYTLIGGADADAGTSEDVLNRRSPRHLSKMAHQAGLKAFIYC